MSKKNIFIVFLLIGGLTLYAQESEVYKLKALKFFCSNKNEMFKLSNPLFQNSSPIFITDFRQEADEFNTDKFHFDSTVFKADTSLISDILKKIEKEDVIENNEFDSIFPSSDGIYALSELLDCIYLHPYIISTIEDSIPIIENSNWCKREFGLHISPVLSYGGVKYVILRIDSYFKDMVDRFQFCVIEFSTDGNVLRGYISRVWGSLIY